MKRTPEAVGRENLESIVGLQQKIIPEMRDLLEKRYELLKHISYHGPIGRRALAARHPGRLQPRPPVPIGSACGWETMCVTSSGVRV